MAVAAEATTTLRVGCRVLCVDYHQPVVLAKELATLDLLSDGRIEAGLGAGWLAGEYEAMGIPFAPPAPRIDRLAAVIDLLRACFAGGEVKIDEAGVFAQGFEAVPKPVQPGGPPIMIGGGSPRVLRLAGAKADIVSLNFDNSSGRIGAGRRRQQHRRPDRGQGRLGARGRRRALRRRSSSRSARTSPPSPTRSTTSSTGSAPPSASRPRSSPPTPTCSSAPSTRSATSSSAGGRPTASAT